MFFRRLFRRLFGRGERSSTRSRISCSSRGRSLYQRRYAETSELSDAQLDSLIESREAEDLPTGVALQVRRDRAAARIAAGGKTYGQRYAETCTQSTHALQALRAQRVAAGLPVGVIDNVLRERGY